MSSADANDIPSSVQIISQDPTTSFTSQASNGYTQTILPTNTAPIVEDNGENHYVFITKHTDTNDMTGITLPHFIQIVPQLQQLLGLQQQAI